MRALTALELLDICEQGWAREPFDRALLMASRACPEMEPAALAHLSIGRRDSLLFRSRELTFGSRVESITECPACGAAVELTFDLAGQGAEAGSVSGDPIGVGEFEISIRLPDTEDLRAASRAGAIEEARRVLFSRCARVRRAGDEIEPEDLPPAVLAAVSEEMERRDPQADVRLSAACPACGHDWAPAFDIAHFFWREVQRAAMKALRDVHTLASAYGWSESEILGMTPWRRQAYLDMASG
jgi:hypothetical protein